MPRSRFVTPTTRRLLLPGNGAEDSITVRDRLTHGESTEGYSYMTFLDKESGQLRTDPRKARDAIVLVYLVDWTLTGPDGTLVEIRGLTRDDLAAVIANLDPLDFGEIYDAIDAHDRATRARLAEEKKTVGATESGPDLMLARHMGWTYADVLDLPEDVYAVLVDDLARESRR